jgi:hypothetical protein
MSITLYDLSIGSFLQMAEATAGILETGKQHCLDNDMLLEEVVAKALHPTMSGFHFQIVCVTHQSLGAIKGLQSGEFGPPRGYAETDYAGLQALTEATVEELKTFTTDEINSFSGGTVTFRMGDIAIPFTSANFIQSFALPNLYFHATTAYDILRSLGAPLGKMNFLGNLRVGS